MDWEEYARSVHNEAFFEAEPVQKMRADALVTRCVGSVLDVGGSDGLIAGLIRDAGHEVFLVDISQRRVDRAIQAGISAAVADACDLREIKDGSYDTVILGEILEHLDLPGLALAEAFRIARQRVVFSLPLNGWEDPTHRWRVSLDRLFDESQHERERTKGEQIVVTMQRGTCWPPGYWVDDPTWHEQFVREAQ